MFSKINTETKSSDYPACMQALADKYGLTYERAELMFRRWMTPAMFAWKEGYDKAMRGDRAWTGWMNKGYPKLEREGYYDDKR